MPTLAHSLATHVSSCELSDYSEHTIAEAKSLIQDYIGVAVRGQATDSGRIAAEYQEQYASHPAEATLLRRGTKISASGAAFANAVGSHSLELDDVDRLALFHFSPPVVSAALAAAEAVDASGRDFLTAVIVGCEIMQAVSEAMNPRLRDRGFHTTPVTGIYGATAAAGKLLGLTTEQQVSAFGIAGAHASGVMEMYGPSMQKRLNPGPAAHNGIASARLAAMGFTGADTIFDGERGVLHTFADVEDDEGRALASLKAGGNLDIEFKPYACARPIHNAIDCALALRDEVGADLDQIQSMTLHRHPSWAHYHINDEPATYHEAQVSINHAVAVVLLEAKAGFEQFGADRIDDDRARRLRQQLDVRPDESLERGVSCRLDIVMADGRQLSATVDHPLGSITNPMSTEDHAAKFEMLVGEKIDSDRQARIRSAVTSIEDLDTIGQLVALVVAD